MKRLSLLVMLATVLFGAPRADAGDRASEALVDYLANDDRSYGFVERRAGRLGDVAWSELTLTSQTWRGIVWKHQLFVLRPEAMPADTRHAMLYVAGGRWSAKYEEPDPDAKLPSSAPLFARVAELVQTPVAILRHVPQQPLFDGLREDALIALTFENYLHTGEADWPLLLPMVKSAVRAMDAVQTHARDAWGLDLKTFTVTGASKRGWTTWLTGAVDERVTAIAPMVIDVLNMGPHLAHQQAVWGTTSSQIADYTERGLHEQLASEAGQALQAIVDPYFYRERLAQPKLLVIGTNDPYWPVDALNLYWDDLPGENRILYVPNQGHKIRDYRRLIGSLNALHRHVARGAPLPGLDWHYEETERGLSLRIESEDRPDEVSVWLARSPLRDFREARWRPVGLVPRDGAWTFDLPRPDKGYVALFGEAVFDRHSEAPAFFSTGLRVLGPEGLDRAAPETPLTP